MTVGEVCKRNVAVIAENETMIDAANHMRALDVDAVAPSWGHLDS